MTQVFESEFSFVSTKTLFDLKTHFLSSPNFLIENYQSQDNKNSLLLAIYLKQLYFFALLKNYVFIIINYIQSAKDQLKAISKRWPENKGFLDGAYKILLIKNVKIRNGKIVTDSESNFHEQTNPNEE